MQALGHGVPTGTPLFAGLEVLRSGQHSVGTELETIFNVMLYVLSEGILSWRHMELQDKNLVSVRFGVMMIEFETKVLSRTPLVCHPMLTRLRDLFFKQGNYVGPAVTCEEFLKECCL